VVNGVVLQVHFLLRIQLLDLEVEGRRGYGNVLTHFVLGSVLTDAVVVQVEIPVLPQDDSIEEVVWLSLHLLAHHLNQLPY